MADMRGRKGNKKYTADQIRSAREAAKKVAECPNPHKRGFLSKRSAKKAITTQRSFANRDDAHPYKCVCGMWHVGHKLGSKGKRLAKQARRLAKEQTS